MSSSDFHHFYEKRHETFKRLPNPNKMKTSKAVFLTILFYVLFQSSFALAQVPGSLQFGAKAGFNYSSLNLSFTGLDKYKTGFHVGAFVKIPVNSHLAIQPEVLYSKKGAQVNYDIDFFMGNVALDLQYLDIPVVGVINLSRTINFQAGPFASILLDSKLKHNSNIPFLNLSYDLGTQLFSKMDYGFIAGGEVNLGKLGTGIRYNYSLGRVEKTKTLLNTDFTLTNARNTVWQIYLKYNF